MEWAYYMRFKTTAQHEKYWKERKIDWKKQYTDTWNHPHRQFLVWALQSFQWVSLWEVGCGPGANLIKITKEMKDKQLGGSDINPEAIELARQTFKGGKFHVETIDDMLLSDDSVDVVLSDATLIYYGSRTIDKAIAEMVRIARNHIVLCEFHGTVWWKRWWLWVTTGYNAYNYEELLEKHGCHSIQIIKLPPTFWEGFPWQPWGYIIIAKVTKI